MSMIDIDKEKRTVLRIRKRDLKQIEKYNNKEKLSAKCIERVKVVIRGLKVNEKFTLKQILSDIWNLMSYNVRRDVGKKFCKLIKHGKVYGIEIYKKENNKTIYIKTA